MTNERPAVPGVSSRRFACDRCCSQKLRCLRDRDEPRCRRCIRVDVACVTTPAVRMSSSLGDDGARRTRQRRQAHRSCEPQPASTSSDSAGETASPQPAPGEAVPGVLADAAAGSTTTDQLPCQVTKSSALLDFVFFPKSPNPNDAESIRHEDDWPFNDQAQTSELLAPDFWCPISSGLVNSPAVRTLNSSQPDHGRGDETIVELGDILYPAGSGARHSGCSLEDMHTQQLLQVNSELLALENRIDSYGSDLTIDILLETVCDGEHRESTLLEKILHVTRKFLDVLASLVGPGLSRPKPVATLVSSASPSMAANPGRVALRVYSGGLTTLPEDSQPSSPSSLKSSLAAKTDLTPNITTQLTVLNCYIHVVRLHVVLFSNIQNFLHQIATSDHPYICPIPGINMSSVPLESGNLQATLYIQIVDSQLERIGKLLGLPRDLQIDPLGREYHGLLSDERFSPILKAVMGKEEIIQPAKNTSGGVKALQRSMLISKQLLRDSIDP